MLASKEHVPALSQQELKGSRARGIRRHIILSSC